MIKKTDRKFERTRRHIRVRTKISGTAERPRLCIYRRGLINIEKTKTKILTK